MRASLQRTLVRFRLEAEELAALGTAARPLASRALYHLETPEDSETQCSSSRPPSSAPARWAARSPRRSPSSDIPVVLKDIDQKFVDHGLEKAREVTKGQLDRLVKKEKLTQEQADARLEEVIGPDRGHDHLRRPSATSTS